MKRTTWAIVASMLIGTSAMAQTPMKEQKVGHVFHISIPDYMTKTVGLNNSASIQFKSNVKDIYGFVIEDNKEELKMAELNYSSLKEFYDDFISDFVKDEEKRTVGTAFSKELGGMKFIENDVTYYDKDAKAMIYYFVGIAEGANSYYKVLCWGVADQKDKYKADFQKVLYSVKDE